MMLVFLWIKKTKTKQKIELHVQNCLGNPELKWKCVISFQTSLLDMHSPISHCPVVTYTPDLCVCSCVSFNVPQIAQDINPLVNLGFEVSANFHGKAGKIDLGVGWEDRHLEFILGTDSLYWILAMFLSPCCLPTPSPLFMGGPF